MYYKYLTLKLFQCHNELLSSKGKFNSVKRQIVIFKSTVIKFVWTPFFQNDTEMNPNWQPDYQTRMGNTRSNRFLDFRVRTDNSGSFLSYSNNDYSSNVPEGGKYFCVGF